MRTKGGERFRPYLVGVPLSQLIAQWDATHLQLVREVLLDRTSEWKPQDRVFISIVLRGDMTGLQALGVTEWLGGLEGFRDEIRIVKASYFFRLQYDSRSERWYLEMMQTLPGGTRVAAQFSLPWLLLAGLP